MEIDQKLDLKRENILDRTTLALSTVMFTLLIVLVSVQVVLRVSNAPIQAVWTEPMARFLFIVGSYFGAAVASRNLEHVRLTLVRERLLDGRERAQSVIDVLTYVAMLLFIAVALWSLYNATIQGWDTQALGGFDALRAGHIYLGMFLGFVCMGIFELQNLIGAVRKLAGPSSQEDSLTGTVGSEDSTEEP